MRGGGPPPVVPSAPVNLGAPLLREVVSIRRLVAVLAAVVVCTGGAVGATAGGAGAASVRSAGVTIQLPPGWRSSVLPAPGGLLAATSRADLFAARLRGGRLTAQPSLSGTSAQSLVGGVDFGPLYNPVVLSENVGTFSAVPVVRYQTATSPTKGETIEVLALTVAPGKAYLFTLEAPSSRWRSLQSTLETMVSDAHFDPAAFPR